MTTTADTAPVYWDPYDIEIDDDPYPAWKRLRDEAPVYFNERFGFYALSRFADVVAASRDTATFSSAHTTVLESMGPEVSDQRLMIFMDPPDHTKLRGLVSRAFTPRRISGLDGRIREICASLLDPLVGSSEFDYVTDFAAQLPSRVISTLVGVPPEDQEEQRRNVDGMFHIEPGVGMRNDQAANSALALVMYLMDLAAKRRDDPQDDLISALVHAEITEDGVERRLTEDEVVSFGVLLYSAGTETVAKLLGNAAVLLAAHPDQRADLVADRSLIPGAVEELLRMEPPSPVQGRWTLSESEWHGTTIPEGSKVLLLTGAASRDDRTFTNPDQFDVHREVPLHVSFGYGIHFCIGASLARLESRIGLEETFDRFPEWNVDPAQAVRVHTSTVRGYSSVPITL
jgi:cytochrome P450